jgi:hypothetical protein
MLAAALEAEVNAYLAQLADVCGEVGQRLVVRNGFQSSARSPPRPGRCRSKRRARYDVQADRVRPGALACGQRTPPGRPCAGGARFERGVLVEREQAGAA